MKKKMVWYALFPHPDCKFMVIPVEGKEPWSMIQEYMLNDDNFTVKFVRHQEGWHEKFREI